MATRINVPPIHPIKITNNPHGKDDGKDSSGGWCKGGGKGDDDGAEQRTQFIHPERHHESIIEIDSPVAALTNSSTKSIEFVITGDQNAGKTTFLHSFVASKDPSFTELTSFAPVIQGYFVNTQYSREVKEDDDGEDNGVKDKFGGKMMFLEKNVDHNDHHDNNREIGNESDSSSILETESSYEDSAAIGDCDSEEEDRVVGNYSKFMDEPPFVDTDVARVALLWSAEDWNFFLDEHEATTTSSSSSSPKCNDELSFNPSATTSAGDAYAMVELVEFGGDHLDALIKKKVGQKKIPSSVAVPSAVLEVEDASLRLLSSPEVSAVVYFINASTFFAEGKRGQEACQRRLAFLDSMRHAGNAAAASLNSAAGSATPVVPGPRPLRVLVVVSRDSPEGTLTHRLRATGGGGILGWQKWKCLILVDIIAVNLVDTTKSPPCLNAAEVSSCLGAMCRTASFVVPPQRSDLGCALDVSDVVRACHALTEGEGIEEEGDPGIIVADDSAPPRYFDAEAIVEKLTGARHHCHHHHHSSAAGKASWWTNTTVISPPAAALRDFVRVARAAADVGLLLLLEKEENVIDGKSNSDREQKGQAADIAVFDRGLVCELDFRKKKIEDPFVPCRVGIVSNQETWRDLVGALLDVASRTSNNFVADDRSSSPRDPENGDTLVSSLLTQRWQRRIEAMPVAWKVTLDQMVSNWRKQEQHQQKQTQFQERDSSSNGRSSSGTTSSDSDVISALRIEAAKKLLTCCQKKK